MLQLHGVERTKNRLVTMVRNAVPEFGGLLEAKLNGALQAGVQGRQIKGLAPDGPIFLVMTSMPKAGGTPSAAAIIRVTSYTEFRNGVLTAEERKAIKSEGGFECVTVNDQTLCFVDRKNGYAVVTSDKEAAALFTKDVAGLDKQLNPALSKKLLDADVSLYINMAAINKEYGTQIQFGRGLAEMMIQQAGGQIGNVQENLDLIKKVLAALFQGVGDSKDLLLAAEFRPEGLALHGEDQFLAKSKTGENLKGASPGAVAGLDRLPPNQMGYIGLQIDDTLFQAFQAMLFGLPGGDEKLSQAAKDALKTLLEAKPRERLDSFNIPLAGLQTIKFDNPAKATEGVLKLLQSLGTGDVYQSFVIKGKPEIKPKAEKHRGFELNHVSLAWDLDKVAANALGGRGDADAKKAMLQVMQKMIGDGLKLWFGTDGKQYLQVVAKDWDAARKLMDEYLDGKTTVGQQASFREARKQMPAEVTMLGLMDFVPYSRSVFDVIKATLGDQIPLPPNYPAAVPLRSSYLGFALVLKPENGGFDVWIPATGAGDLYKMFVEPLMKAGG